MPGSAASAGRPYVSGLPGLRAAGRRPAAWTAVAPPVRVFLVDDHEVVRRGVAEVLEDDPGITVAGEAGSCAEALARVPAVRPDVVVLDMRLPDGDGADLCRRLRARLPGPALPGADQLLRAGGPRRRRPGRGVGLPAQAGPRPGPGLGGAHGRGRRHPVRRRSRRPPPRTRRPGRAGSDRLGTLTDQERSVLRLIGEGLTNRQIGERMGLAEKTVKNYTSHLLAKLGLERRTQAAILATAAAGPLTGLTGPAGRRAGDRPGDLGARVGAGRR